MCSIGVDVVEGCVYGEGGEREKVRERGRGEREREGEREAFVTVMVTIHISYCVQESVCIQYIGNNLTSLWYFNLLNMC